MKGNGNIVFSVDMSRKFLRDYSLKFMMSFLPVFHVIVLRFLFGIAWNSAKKTNNVFCFDEYSEKKTKNILCYDECFEKKTNNILCYDEKLSYIVQEVH